MLHVECQFFVKSLHSVLILRALTPGLFLSLQFPFSECLHHSRTASSLTVFTKFPWTSIVPRGKNLTTERWFLRLCLLSELTSSGINSTDFRFQVSRSLMWLVAKFCLLRSRSLNVIFGTCRIRLKQLNIMKRQRYGKNVAFPLTL